MQILLCFLLCVIPGLACRQVQPWPEHGMTSFGIVRFTADSMHKARTKNFCSLSNISSAAQWTELRSPALPCTSRIISENLSLPLLVLCRFGSSQSTPLLASTVGRLQSLEHLRW